MSVDGLPDALDTAMVVHSRHGLVEQVVTVGGEDVKAQNLTIGLIHNRLESPRRSPMARGRAPSAATLPTVTS